MDLEAYVNIGNDEIEEIVKENNIYVPRLRGYRLMKYEEPVSKEEIQVMYEDAELDELELKITGFPYFSMHPIYCEYCSWTSRFISYYTSTDESGKKHVDWSKIHGWKRKNLKFAIKKRKRRIKEQFDMFNKYAGREDILYIHSRIGGGNWAMYKDEVIHEPWFIESVEDSLDRTYCDIYARIQR